MAEPPGEKNSRDKNIWMQIGRYSHLALVLPASAIVGLFLGMALDRWLKTSWITIVGLVFGSVAGLTELIRSLMRISKES
jgi:F0F1-type ATP synthase assembly protein I